MLELLADYPADCWLLLCWSQSPQAGSVLLAKLTVAKIGHTMRLGVLVELLTLAIAVTCCWTGWECGWPETVSWGWLGGLGGHTGHEVGGWVCLQACP